MAPVPADTEPRDPIDDALLPLLDAAECATATRSRIPVLSLWTRLPFVPLLASHLHLRWPGAVKSLPLSPRIGIFPFFASDLELLSRPLYHVQKAQAARQSARARRFSAGSKTKGDLYPDWEQAIDRRRKKLEHLVLPASSFISIDRVDDVGNIRQGNRRILGRFTPRNELKPQLLVSGRVEATRQLVRAFDTLDLVIVNAQNIRGRQLAASIAYFLSEISQNVPILIIASSPADLSFVRALEPPSTKPVLVCNIQTAPRMSVKAVNRDRPIAERQFCFAVDGLAERSGLLGRLVTHAERTWWATRQSMSMDVPREALAFENLCADLLTRIPEGELELLEEAKRLILAQAHDPIARDERRDAVIRAVFHETKARSILVVVRSDAAADELKSVLAAYLDVTLHDLAALGIDVVNVFGPWPTKLYEACIAAGYFGTGTIDMLFAGRGSNTVVIVDPIEARIAIWDIEKRFCAVPELPEAIAASLRSFSATLESCAAPSTEPISLSTLLGEGGRHASATTSASSYSGKVTYVCLCFSDGSTQQIAANARFEVLGRKRLQLQSVAAKDLHVGDQVVLLNDDERAAFSERLLQLMDEGRLKADSQSRSIWITTLRAVLSVRPVSISDIRKRMETDGITIDPATIRTWFPPNASDECGVPDRENVFQAFARALEMVIPEEVLGDWFAGINRLRINHRQIGRELVRAIRGAYFGRLDPITIAKMEREWGVEAKVLLEAARVAIVDDVIPLAQ